MSRESLRILEEGHAQLESIVRDMRRKFLPTDEEIEAEARMAVEEERAPEPPLPPRPRGHRWQDTFLKHLHKWRGRP